MKYVPGYGSSVAKLMIVGDAPSKGDANSGRPFSDKTGQLVSEMIGFEAFNSSYKTNVGKNYLVNMDEVRQNKNIEDCYPQLFEEIDALKPNCILAYGSVAFKALTGYTDLPDRRGSVLLADGRRIKVVGTYHPNSLLHGGSEGKARDWRDKVIIEFDSKRAVEQSTFADYRIPQRTRIICRSALDFWRFLERNADSNVLSVDIETFKCIPITIGFSFKASEAISVPILNLQTAKNPDGMGMHQLVQIWEAIIDLLARPDIKLVGQNLKFDQGRLEEIKVFCANIWFDTLLAFSELYPEISPKNLGMQTSLFTLEPYYKSDGKEFNFMREKTLDKLMIYNCSDAAVTYEIYEREMEELRDANLLNRFFEKTMPLHNFYRGIESRGICRDPVAHKELLNKYESLLSTKRARLNELAGYEINANSPKQVSILLYEQLKCPRRVDTAEKTLSALMRNAVKDPKKREIINSVLEIRKVRKTIGTYINAETGPYRDDRMYCSYLITGTETGRTSTNILEPPVVVGKHGLAFQTITKYGEFGGDIRGMYIPSKGKILIEPDESQAEARIVAELAEDEIMKNIFKHYDAATTPDEKRHWDLHIKTAVMMLGLREDEVTEDDRQKGKKSRHSGHYDATKVALARDLGCSEWAADKLLTKFHDANPNIRNVYHVGIREALELSLEQEGSLILRTPYGRRRQFFNKWGPELWREAYAYIPQSVVSDHLKYAAMRIEKRCPWLAILGEFHDSFLGEIDDNLQLLIKTWQIIKEEMERPISFSKCSLRRGTVIIPCDMKCSRTSWLNMIKYEKFLKTYEVAA